MLIDKLTGELAKQFSNTDLPVSNKCYVEVSCVCGAVTKISTRALARKWGARGYYLCKSCSVKSYISEPERLKKFQQSISETASTLEHKAKCSRAAKKLWDTPELRERVTEAVRQDNKTNPKKAKARAIALQALKNKTWFKDHMDKIRILAHQVIAVSVLSDHDKWSDLAKNFHFERPEVREKHRDAISSGRRRHKHKTVSYEELDKQIKASSDYIAKKEAMVAKEAYQAILSTIVIPEKQKRSKNGSVEHKAKMSAATKSLWADKEYRDMVLSKLRAKALENWTYVEYRKHLLEIFSSDEFKTTQANISRARWQDMAYRQKVIANTIEALTDPKKRLRMSEASKKLWQNAAFKEKMASVRAAQSEHTSSIQRMLYTYLDDLGIQYHKEGERTRIGHYVFDCAIPNLGNKTLLIECQGDYWHSLAKAEQNDKSKFTYISKYFPECEIMYIWEHEFYCKDRVLDRLKLKLGLTLETKQFDFSELCVKEAGLGETKEFLDLYHYLGKDRGGKAYGAYLDEELIACIVFSPPLRQNTAGQFDLNNGDVRELSRLCIHPLYHKKNFASWFIKRTLKQIDCKLVIAYADVTVGHTGAIYKASNFTLHHTVPADYWYVDTDGYVMHKRTLYGKAVKNHMTEAEFAESKGYIKKYGGEKLCFVYNQR